MKHFILYSGVLLLGLGTYTLKHPERISEVTRAEELSENLAKLRKERRDLEDKLRSGQDVEILLEKVRELDRQINLESSALIRSLSGV